ncbi:MULTISPECIES: ImmA/IrrE family metallo-endopeptidase [unclassified Microcoleus]|uniref:ImmA/IrrE family metallo-endopeptidase n=1 Tax=unclassified Microcoleus TaxID=2642155 RepID=UPI002FD71208
MTEAAGYIAKRLGLNISSLLQTDAPITFKSANSPKFKKRQGTDEKSLLVAQNLAIRVAEMVDYAFVSNSIDISEKTRKIRQEIIENHGCVNLTSLIKFCWQHGIAVVHFADFPKKVCKMDGMVSRAKKRPVIIISSSQRFSAWLLFILAHELGHLICGHVSEGILIDEKIDREGSDKEEDEANNFACQLLYGEVEKYHWQPKMSPIQLATYVQKIGKQDQVDPGALALNYAWQMKDWAAGLGALKRIEPQANASALINGYMAENIDWERLDEDSQDYLKLVTGVV